jgi:hypothetical protein
MSAKAAPLTPQEAREAHERLAAQVRRHNDLYYNRQPEIDDAAYDALWRELETLEAAYPELITPDSPTQTVGAAPSSGFKKVKHEVPMLSLSNVFSEEELADFFARIRRFLGLAEEEKIGIVAEPKIDGLSCSLRYEKRKLKVAATRGDGYEGEDITANIRTVGDVPRDLYAPRRFPEDERAAGAGRQAGFRQSAQRRGGQRAPARCRGFGGAAIALFRLCARRRQRGFRAEPVGAAREAEGMGLPGNQGEKMRKPRRNHGLLRRDGAAAPRSPL